MGLDIYLYARAEQDASDAYDKAWDDIYESGRWSVMTEEEKDTWRADNPSPHGRDEVKSERYPEHYFNRRYLRSSYNGGGFNRAVPEMVGADHDLYWVFEPARGYTDEYEIEFTAASIEALRECRARALQVAEELRACDPLRTMSGSALIGDADHLWHQPPTAAEVLAWYREESVRMAGREDGDAYSCAKGTVLGFKSGIDVPAVTTARGFGGSEAIVVYRPDPTVKDFYIQGAEVAAEFCDEAIALVERDGSVFMHWSG